MREWLMLAPVAAAVLWMGVYPESFLAPMRADIAALDARVSRSEPVSDSQFKLGAPKPAAAHADHSNHAAPAAHDAPEGGAH